MKITSVIVSNEVKADEKNRLSLIGVFDIISAPDFPARHSKMFITVITEGEPAEYRFHVTINDGEQELIGADEIIQIASLRHNYVISFENVIFPRAGIYTVVVKVNNEISSTTIELVNSND